MAFAIFVVSYLFIAGLRIPKLRLDRVGGALLGAVAMIALGVVSPAAAFGHSVDPAKRAIDLDTLILLFAMMLLAAYLSEARFFRAAAAWAVRFVRTPRGLLVAVAVVSAALSLFLVNDTVCLMLTPLVLTVVADAELPAVPYLLALCMASNAGSAATFTGNPQNMLIGVTSHLPFARFTAFMAIPAILSVAVVVALLLWIYRKQLPRTRLRESVAVAIDRRLFTVTAAVLACVVAAFFAGLPMSWSALVGAAVVLLLANRSPRDSLAKVDYVLLVFFASLFIVIYGVSSSGAVERMRHFFAPLLVGGVGHQAYGFALLSVVASNLFSNVPFVMLARQWVPGMPNPTLGWEVLALTSTLAGNLTLVGSVANLIVFEGARNEAELSFLGYLKVGLPVTVISVALGVAVLLAEHALFG